MIAYLTKSDGSKGFNQIINFLNGSSITYALTVNPNIYVSCIKQFWTIVAVKKVNDVTRLQDLVDKKKVVVTEASIRDALRLGDAKGVDCLPNEEIFTKLARMDCEKPSTMLTFYKTFFSTSRKFNFSKYIFDSLIRNVDSTTKFYMYPRFLQLIIRKQVGDLSTHTTKYNSPALTQKVFTNMRRVGKGFFGVETPLFEGMLVAYEVRDEGEDEVPVGDVNAEGDAKGVVSAADDVVPTTEEEPSITSPSPPTLPPQPSQDIPSTSQVQLTPPQSPQVQPLSPQQQQQPSQDAEIPMDLLHTLLDTCTTLTRRLERGYKVKVLKLRRLQKVETAQRINTSDDTVMNDVSNQGRMYMDQDVEVGLEEDKDVDADIVKDVQDAESAQDQGRKAKYQVEIYKIDMGHAQKVLITVASDPITAASTTINVAEAQVPAATLIAAPLRVTAAPLRVTAAPSRRRKGAVIKDPEESSPSIIIPAETKSKNKGKGILLNRNVDWDKVIDHVNKKAKEDPAVKKYQALKRKPQTEAQARKNMIVYLKNVVGFKMDYFNGISYDDIRPIFEAKFNTNMAFLQKTKEHIEEEESRALKRLNETLAEKAAKRQKLDEEVPIMDYKIYNEHNKPYYKIKRGDGSHQLYLSFISMLKNFDREDLEALWRLVKEKFTTTKPKNFFDDFLLITLGAMFEKPDIHAQIWKNQRSVHGQAKVKSWKLLESCGVQIITFTTTQLILLVEKKYPLTKFTLNQMINNVRLEVKEESEVSLELLRFLTMTALYILDKLSEVANSSQLEDKMKALGQRADVLKSLEYMREMVARDSARVGVLEQLLVGAHVGMRLKAEYVADMGETV
uniref:Xylulose kinase-1 n=1 Tax=Tanacetum cinerariifolium TaxID=118510 RepID=A0A6L2KU19_TANCI|nr:hypothetical protein [Tanacetum cinerariifolium]